MTNRIGSILAPKWKLEIAKKKCIPKQRQTKHVECSSYTTIAPTTFNIHHCVVQISTQIKWKWSKFKTKTHFSVCLLNKIQKKTFHSHLNIHSKWRRMMMTSNLDVSGSHSHSTSANSIRETHKPLKIFDSKYIALWAKFHGRHSELVPIQ